MTIGPHDLIDLPSGQYEVIGYPEDTSKGPFGMPAGFPTPYTVGHHVCSGFGKDGYNREIRVYTPAKGAAGTPLEVHGWANPGNTEPKIAGHERVIVEVELYMPPCLVVNLRRSEG